MAEPAMIVESGDGIGWITLNRPDALNAINDGIRLNMPGAIRSLNNDPDVRVIVIRAAGSKAFSVGADVKESRGAETPVQARERMTNAPWIESVAESAKPVIASIGGFCMGGGCELALACDIRIASPNAVFALPEIDLGLLPGGGGTQRLPRLIGAARALDLLLTAERVSAARALEFGMITRLSESNETLAAETLKLAAAIVKKPPLSVRYIKEAALKGLGLRLADGLVLERNLFTLLLSTEDRVEAAKAFLEKRPGHFSGR